MTNRLTSEVTVHVDDIQVLNDFMPGSPAKCHAVMLVRMLNNTDQDLILRRARGMLLDAYHRVPLRSFPAECEFQDVAVKDFRLPPGIEIQMTLRTPMTIPPVDRSLYPRVILTVSFETSLGRTLELESPASDIFETQ